MSERGPDQDSGRLTSGSSTSWYTPTLPFNRSRNRRHTPVDIPARTTLDGGEIRMSGVLGLGGSGVVELGNQRSLGRDIAVKRVHNPSDERAVRELLREASITARLAHPAIVPVHRVFEETGLGPVVVMRYVDGRTWRSTLQGPVAPERVAEQVRTVIELCYALEYAHSQEVLHLDLKPDNVLVGSYGEVYLIDWGIAMDLRQEPVRERVCGTPAYMAPEMLDPERAAISVRSDVYLLAGSLFEALHGHPPHRSPVIVEAMQAALRPVEWPSTQRVPIELDRILRRALSQDPEDRHPDVRSLRAELEAFLTHQDAERLLCRVSEELRDARRTIDRKTLKTLSDRVETALELWPSSQTAHRLLREITARRVEVALREKDLAEAQRLVDGEVPLPGRLVLAVEQLEGIARQNAEHLAGLTLHDQPSLDGQERVLQGFLALSMVLGGALLFLRTGPLFQPAELLVQLGVLIVGWAALLGLRWKDVSGTWAARAAVQTVTVVMAGMLFNRVIGWRLGTAGVDVVRVDLLLAGVAFVLRSHLHFAFIPTGLVFLTCSAAASLYPEHARTIILVAPALATAAALRFWRRRGPL